MERLRSLALNLLLAGMAVLLTIGLFELGARLLVPEWTPKHAARNFWTHDALLGWVHVPGASGVQDHRDFSVRIENNDHGLRDDDYSFERVPGKRRLLLLGDSFGWGFGVEFEENMIEILDERHPDWEMINASVAGYGTDQQLLYYRETGHRYQPDVVLLLFHPNDIEDNNDDYRYRYYKPHFELGPEGELVLTKVPVRELTRRQTIERFLHQRTFVLIRIWELFEDVEGALRDALRGGAANAAALDGEPSSDRSGELVLVPPELPPPPPAEELPKGREGRDVDLRRTRALVSLLAEEVRDDGAEFAVITIPGWPDPERALSDVLEQQGIPYLSLAPSFRGVPREESKFEHDPHWNAGGHAIAAEAVDDFLEERGLLD
ncbi:MAG: hypothetical protein QNK05_00150 [Myxococcota bacterium]|nr:hypothetical protein [Myxococcota bacterium]